jgi:hypothetical protein
VEQKRDRLLPGWNVPVNARPVVLTFHVSLGIGPVFLVVIVGVRGLQRRFSREGLFCLRFRQGRFGRWFSPGASIARATAAATTRSPGFFDFGLAPRFFRGFLFGPRPLLVLNLTRGFVHRLGAFWSVGRSLSARP